MVDDTLMAGTSRPFPEPETRRIQAILFDMNGTLCQRIPDPEWQRWNKERLLSMLGRSAAPPSYLDELAGRYKTYTQWADETQTALPEAEIWTRWMVPELSQESIRPQAVELMLAFRDRKGRKILKPGAREVIDSLHQGGVRLGVISNSTSTVELPRLIEANGLRSFFEVVLISSICGSRKPHPAIFLEASRTLQLEPARCSYLGNKPATDILGPRLAGYGLAMLIAPGTLAPASRQNALEDPDLLIHDLAELLDIFLP